MVPFKEPRPVIILSLLISLAAILTLYLTGVGPHTLLEMGILGAICIMIVLAARVIALSERRVSATVVTIMVLGSLAPILFSQMGVQASPDTFYLHDASTAGVSPAGKYMDSSQGSGGASMIFDTVGQSAYWYTDTSFESGLESGSYTLNMHFSELPRPWWDSGYLYRQSLNLTAGSTAIPAGYPVKLALDHNSLVVAGKSQADGDDLRVLRWNGTAWNELSRVLGSNSAWNNSATTILFKTQTQISASGYENSYFLYYGNTSAVSPPTSGVATARYYLAESLSETQTSSTTYASKVQLQFTPGNASEQWVIVATWRQRHVATSTANELLGDARIRVNGAARTGTDLIGYKQLGGPWMARSALFKITGSASQQTIDIDFRAAGGTDGIDTARILAFMIPGEANADIQYAETLTKTTDTSNPSYPQNLTFSPSSAGDYVWLSTAYFHEGPGGGSNGGFEIWDETGAQRQGAEETYTSETETFTVQTHFQVRTLSTSSKTFTFLHRPDTAGGERQGLTQILFRADAFDAVESASSEGDSTTTSTSYQTKNSLTTASVSSAHDYIYLTIMALDHSSTDITNSVFAEARLAGTQMLEAEQQINRGSYLSSIAWAYAEEVAGNRALDNRFRTTAGTYTAHAQWAQIVSLRYKEAGMSLGNEEQEGVKLSISVHHTKTDGTDAQEIVTNSAVTITGTTSNPVAVNLGTGATQVFSSSDPRLIRLWINVTDANSERFILAYDSGSNPSSLDTPVVTSGKPSLTNPTLNPTSGTPATPFNFTVDYSHPLGIAANTVKVNVSDAANNTYNNLTLSPTQAPELDYYVTNHWDIDGSVSNFANMQADQGSYATLSQNTTGSEEPPAPPTQGSSILEASATSTTTTSSTSYVLMNSMSITPGAGDYLAVFSTSVSDSSVAWIRISIFVNGVQLAHTEREQYQESSIAGTPIAIGTHAHVTVGASQTVEVRWLVTAGTGTAYSRTLNLFPVDSGDVSEATATSDDSTSSTSYIQLGSMTLTPGAGDYLLLFSSSAESSSSSDPVMAFAAYVNGAIVQHSERVVLEENSIPSTSLPVFIAAKVSPGASQAVEIRWAVQAGSGTIVAHERTLTLCKIDSANILEASATSDTSATNTADALLNSMSLTPGAGEYLALFSESHRYGTIGVNPNTYYSLYVNGAQITQTEHISGHEGSLDNTDLAGMTNGVVSPGAGETVEVQWRSSTTDSRTSHERTLVLVKTASAGGIVLDNVTSANGATSPLTFSHPIGSGAHRLLVVTIAVEGAPANATVTAVTYNSVSLTKAIAHNVGTGTDMNLEIWYMLNASLPSTGSYTVSVATAGGITDIIAGAISVTGAAQKSPEAIASNDDGGAGNEWIETQITVPTDDSWIFDVVGIGDTSRTFTGNSGQAEAYDIAASSSVSAAGTTSVQTAGTQTLNWTVNGGDVTTRIAHALASFAPAYSVGGVELDNVSSGNSTGSPLTFSHTIGGGSNRVLVVLIGLEAAIGNSTIGSVTYNGVSMTLAAQNASGTSYHLRTAIYYLLDASLPTPGSYTVSITASLADEIQAGAISLTGVAQQGPDATATNDDGETGSPGIETQITTIKNNSWVFDVVGSGNVVGFTPNSGQIEWFDLQGGSSTTAGAYRKVATAGAETLNWTTSGSNRLSQTLAAFGPAPPTSKLLVQLNTTTIRSGGDDTVVFRYNLTTSDDSFGLWVWNFTASDWGLRGTLDQTTLSFLNVTLDGDEVSGGVVQLRLNDTSNAGSTNLSIGYQLVHNNLWRTGVTYYINTTLSSGNYSHFFWANTSSGSSNKTAVLPGPLVNAIPTISNFRLVNATGASMVGQQLDVGVPYFFLFNVTEQDGWSDIGQDGTIALRLWYDGNQGPELLFTDQTTGENYRIVLQYTDTSDPTTASLNEWSIVEGSASYNASASSLTEIYATWSLSDWSYRKKITIDSTKVSGDLSNFPVLISLAADSDLAARAQADGDDILFTSSDGSTKLNHEIERFNSTTGELVAWVNVTDVSSTVDTDIYMYYGNAGASNQESAADVWDSNYLGVWHLSEEQSGTGNPGVYLDSTSNSYDGIDNISATGQEGRVGSGHEFDGVADFIDLGSSLPNLTTATWEAWIKPSSTALEVIIGKWVDPGDDGWLFGMRSGAACTTDRVCVETPNDVGYSSATSVYLNVWQHVAATADGSNVVFYVNGTGDSPLSQSQAISNAGVSTYIGLLPDFNTWDYSGFMDEVRLSKVARSAAWMSTQHNNQNSPTTFYSVGTEAGLWSELWSSRKKITIDAAKVMGDLTNFPVLLRITDIDLRDDAQSDGDDILFTSSDGMTKLNHEIESFNGSTGELVAWVNVTSLSSTIDTEIYMYYGNPTATSQENVNGTWDGNYVAVWHLNESPADGVPGHEDSTSNNNDGTPQNFQDGGGGTTNATGIIDGADDFGGDDDIVQFPNSGSLDITGDKITIELWMRLDSTFDSSAPQDQTLIDGGGKIEYWLENSDGAVHFSLNTGGWQALVSNQISWAGGSWYHLVGVYDGSNRYFYVNGTQDNTIADTGNLQASGGAGPRISNSAPTTNEGPFNGIIDEVRFSNIGRSAAWVQTSFSNRNDSAFFSVGNEEGAGSLIGYEFKLAVTLGYQVKHALAPTNSTPGGYNDPDSWNAEIMADDGANNSILQTASTGEHMEFGVYMYTFVNISANWAVTLDPAQSGSTNSVTVYYRSNDDFLMKIWFTTHLVKGGDTIDISNVQILAAGDANDNITSDTAFGGLGEANAVYIFGSATWWFPHSVDGDENTVVVQFSVDVPGGTPWGTYVAQLTIRLIQVPA